MSTRWIAKFSEKDKNALNNTKNEYAWKDLYDKLAPKYKGKKQSKKPLAKNKSSKKLSKKGRKRGSYKPRKK